MCSSKSLWTSIMFLPVKEKARNWLKMKKKNQSEYYYSLDILWNTVPKLGWFEMWNIVFRNIIHCIYRDYILTSRSRVREINRKFALFYRRNRIRRLTSNDEEFERSMFEHRELPVWFLMYDVTENMLFQIIPSECSLQKLKKYI